MPTLRDRFRSVDTTDGGIVLDVDNGRMFRLNPTGMRMLALLQQEVPTERVAERISRECGVDVEIVRADLRDFSELLAERGLLPTDAPSSGR